MYGEGVNISQILQKFFSGCVSGQNQLFPLGQGRGRCPDPQKQSATALCLARGIPFLSSEWDPIRIEIIFTQDMLSSISLEEDEEKTGGSWDMFGGPLNRLLVGNT